MTSIALRLRVGRENGKAGTPHHQFGRLRGALGRKDRSRSLQRPDPHGSHHGTARRRKPRTDPGYKRVIHGLPAETSNRQTRQARRIGTLSQTLPGAARPWTPGRFVQNSRTALDCDGRLIQGPRLAPLSSATSVPRGTRPQPSSRSGTDFRPRAPRQNGLFAFKIGLPATRRPVKKSLAAGRLFAMSHPYASVGTLPSPRRAEATLRSP